MSSARDIGPHIQRLRKQRRMTLDDLARASGVSRSMLSQVERGQANPTLATVWALADAFGIGVSELIDQAGPERAILVSPAAQTPEMRSDDGGCLIRVLSPGDSVGRLEWYELAFQPRSVLASEAHARGSREHLTVLDGILTVHLEGHHMEVGPGATARYPVDSAHAIENATDRPARALLIVAF